MTKTERLTENLQDAKRGCQLPQSVLDELLEIVNDLASAKAQVAAAASAAVPPAVAEESPEEALPFPTEVPAAEVEDEYDSEESDDQDDEEDPASPPKPKKKPAHKAPAHKK